MIILLDIKQFDIIPLVEVIFVTVNDEVGEWKA